MAEPTCVMQPFSYTTTPTPFSNETPQEINPSMYGLEESISFGRYVCEDLEWEKWSSFNSNNRNRYVAEAEKYSKPGSVAQKKAYFEAHFKRMAALKAAALLEQEQNDAAHVNAFNDTLRDQANHVTTYDHGQDLNSSSNLQLQINDFKQPKNSNTGEFVVHHNELYSNEAKEDEYEVNNHIGKEVNPSPPPPPPPPDHRSSQKYEVMVIKNEENHEVQNEESSTEINNQMERPLLQEESTEVAVVVKKKKTPLSSYISSPAVVFAPSPGKSDLIHPGKENYTTPIKNSKSSISSDPQKRRTPLRMSINREFNRILSPVIKKLGNSSKTSTPAKASVNNNIPQPQPMTPDLSTTGASISPSTGRRKISSPIIPNSFCLSNGERTARRKQKLEDKFNATTTERASQPSKFKEKAEAELNKFRQSFCFKAMSSPDYYGDNGTFKSPKHKNESTQCKSPNGGLQSNRTTSQSTSSLPPRRPSVKQNGLRSKRTTLMPS